MDKRKYLDLIVLLMVSVFVVSVSAQLYYSLEMTSTIDVYAADVHFVVGSDNGIKGLAVTLGANATTVTLTGLRAYPNATFTYTNATLVKNDGSDASIRLAPSSISDGAADFEYVKFLLNATAVLDRRWLNYTSDGSNWNSPSASGWTTLGSGAMWPIVIITRARADSTSGNSVTIGVTVDVD